MKDKANNDFSRILDSLCPKMRVKLLRDIEYPFVSNKNGDWFDLVCAEDTMLEPNEYKAIPLGFSAELPKGYEALIVPRSSLFKNHGVLLANSLGVIDESYCGDNDEWHFLAYATRLTKIEKGERIAQFRIIQHQPLILVTIVDELGNQDRKGIGSTGRF